MENIKGIIFDYGGTIDSRGDHWSHIIRDGWTHAGLGPDRVADQPFRDAYVFAEREMAKVRHVLPHHTFADLMLIKMKLEMGWLAEQGLISRGEADAAAPVAAVYCYRAARASVDEARPVLEQLHGRYPLVLVSNFYGNVNAVLRDFGLAPLFRDVIESAVVGVRKPDPRIFALGVEALGLKPGEVLVVGDSLRKDILPARSLGCQTAWIKGRGWTPEEDASTDPAQIPSLAALLPRLLPQQ